MCATLCEETAPEIRARSLLFARQCIGAGFAIVSLPAPSLVCAAQPTSYSLPHEWRYLLTGAIGTAALNTMYRPFPIENTGQRKLPAIVRGTLIRMRSS